MINPFRTGKKKISLERVKELERLFNRNKNLSAKVQSLLKAHIQLNNVGDQYLFTGITFSEYHAIMERNYVENFSNEKLKLFNSPGLSEEDIDLMIQTYQTQYDTLCILEAKLNDRL